MSKKRQVQKLRPETKKIILSAWSEEFKAAGLPSLDEARERMEALLKRPEQHQAQEFALSGMALGSAWTPIAILEKQMDEWNEPTPEELKDTLKRINGFRYDMRRIIGEATKKLLKSLIRRVGGRHLKLEVDRHGEVCREVADLVLKKVKLRVAFERVGSRHNVSGRTIQRIWQKRPTEYSGASKENLERADQLPK